MGKFREKVWENWAKIEGKSMEKLSKKLGKRRWKIKKKLTIQIREKSMGKLWGKWGK